NYFQPLPAPLSSMKLVQDKWVAAPAPYENLKVMKATGGLVLRYEGVMDKKTYDKLLKLSPATGTEIDEFDSDGTGNFRDAVITLNQRTNLRKVYARELPAALMPANLPEFEWVAAPAPYSTLEVRR